MFGRRSSGDAAPPPVSKSPSRPTPARPGSAMSGGQKAYEERRAKEAGVSLETWLARKRSASTPAVPTRAPPAPRRKGLLSRLLDKAHEPLK